MSVLRETAKRQRRKLAVREEYKRKKEKKEGRKEEWKEGENFRVSGPDQPFSSDAISICVSLRCKAMQYR